MSSLGRRAFLLVAGSLGAGITAFAGSSSASEGSSQAKCLSIRDPRVARFVAFRSATFDNPVKAFNLFTTPDIVYTSTCGQRFSSRQTIDRIEQWNKAFKRSSAIPALAAELDANTILVIYDQTLSQVDQFRGVKSSTGTFDLRIYFTVTFNKSNMITSYSSYLDYGHLAKSIGSNHSIELLGMS